MFVWDLITGRIAKNEINQILKYGMISSIVAIIVSVTIDSYLWRI